MKKAFTNKSSSRKVSVRDIMSFLLRPILRTATLRNDEAGVRAFTLIELLVVVLIIGILAAIALPQYQAAVVKTRASTWLPVSKALLDAQEVYYLTNTSYATDVANLDIDIPPECSIWNKAGYDQMLVCGNNNFSLSIGNDDRASIAYCPGDANDPVTCRSTRDFQISMYGQNHASRANQRICWITNNSSLGKKVCSGLGGFEAILDD